MFIRLGMDGISLCGEIAGQIVLCSVSYVRKLADKWEAAGFNHILFEPCEYCQHDLRT